MLFFSVFRRESRAFPVSFAYSGVRVLRASSTANCVNSEECGSEKRLVINLYFCRERTVGWPQGTKTVRSSSRKRPRENDPERSEHSGRAFGRRTEGSCERSVSQCRGEQRTSELSKRAERCGAAESALFRKAIFSASFGNAQKKGNFYYSKEECNNTRQHGSRV